MKANVKQKVLFILHLPPPVHGAAVVGKYIAESEAVNKVLDCQFINLSTSNKLDEIGKGNARKLLAVFLIQWKVIKAILKTNPDLCYMTLTATGAGFYKDMVIVFTLKLLRRKIIYHFHNKGISANKNKWLDNMLYRFAFKNTRSILTSKHLYYDIEKYVTPENVCYCPNGSRADKEVSNSCFKDTENSPTLKILFLSNLMVEKGVLILIEACKLLKHKNLKFECHLVGAFIDISEGDLVQLIKKEELESHVYVHGKKYNGEKVQFLKSADVFVFPTFYHNECFPLALLEAMQYSLPVLSTNEGGIPDIVIDGETGFIVPKQNAEALVEKIELFIKHPDLCSQMGTSGRKRFEELFTIEKFEKTFLEILKRSLPKND